MTSRFRVWCIAENYMWYPDRNDYLYLDIDGLLYQYDEKYSRLREYTHCVSMRSTGPGDGERQELFEGDIVEVSRFNNMRSVVVFEDEAFHLRIGSISIAICNLTATERVTIKRVGNIYENPELLKHKETGK